MSDTAKLVSSFIFTLGGAPVSPDLYTAISEVRVENSLHMPDMATLVINDPALKWIDHAQFFPGVELKIQAAFGNTTPTIFSGEIVEIEPEFTDGTQLLTVRAFDRLHRLTHGHTVQTFQNASDGDIVRKIAASVGLQAQVGPTPEVHEYVIQSGITHLEFVQQRAARLGFLVYVEDRTLHVVPPKTESAVASLKIFEDLFEFRPRLTTVGQVKEVQVRGWDVKQKREILGKATTSTSMPKIQLGKDGGQVIQQAFNLKPSYLVNDHVVRSQGSADKLAKATLDRLSATFVEAEGVANGNSKIKAGVTITINQVGSRFSGSYFVTSSTHSFTDEEGYRTAFTVSGLHPTTLINLLAPPETPASGSHLAVALVTDNNDPENLGRVKVKFPWLSDEHASNWARVVSPGGGATRGFVVIPEVNDEVLVGFDMGDINHPFVIGGLWNGKDKPPYQTSALIKSGKVEKWSIYSRTGHEISFDESDKGGITIKDKNGNQLVITIDQDKLTLTSKGDMTFDSQGNMTLKAGKAFTVEAGGKGEVKTMGLSLDGKTSPTEVKGMGVKVEGGGGTVDVKGSMINLN